MPEENQRKTTMRISRATLVRLHRFGDFGDTYEKIIIKLLDMAEKQYQGGSDEQGTQRS